MRSFATLAATSFPANNAVVQIAVDVLLDGTIQDITSLFDFTDVYFTTLPNQLPLGLWPVHRSWKQQSSAGHGDGRSIWNTAPTLNPVASLSVTLRPGPSLGTQVTITVTTSITQ
jgi:hypothetical protein